ncbi:MAG: hypothetical protein WC372_09155 [Candidatus Neomarinimicrobiota bacterium]|jgi:hypothetical protein
MTFEEFRQTIIGVFKTAHDTSYPATLVDYPNQQVVDVEHQKDPWVRLELVTNDNRQMCFGQSFTRVSGWLYIAVNVLPNSGTKWQTQYTDFLDSQFSLQVIQGITFKELVPLPGVLYPAWHTVRNVLPFTFEKFN